VPEVVGVEFRYFDGQGWSDEWNSLTRKSLPMAVEVVLRLKRAEPAGPLREPPRGEEIRAEGSLTEPPDRSQVAAGETHRLLVYMGSTSLARRTESEKLSVAGPAPVAVYRPRSLPISPPAPAGPRKPAQTSLPDQWMRTGQ
jgi:hypothetical protein